MIVQGLAVIALSVAAPVLTALVVRLWGVPGERTLSPVLLWVSMASVAAGCGWVFYRLPHSGNNASLYVIGAMALICTGCVCYKLLLPRLRAHWLLAQDHWSCEEVVELLQLVVRFYHKPSADFRLKIWHVEGEPSDENGPGKPAQLRVFIDGQQKWQRALEVGWVDEIIDQIGRAFNYNGERSLVKERCVDLIWSSGAHTPEFEFHDTSVSVAV